MEITLYNTLEAHKDLLKALKWVMLGCSDDKARPVLQGVMFEPDKNRIVATDGFHIHILSYDGNYKDLLGEIAGNFEVTIIPVAKLKQTRINFEKIEGTYPDYTCVINTTYNVSILDKGSETHSVFYTGFNAKYIGVSQLPDANMIRMATVADGRAFIFSSTDSFLGMAVVMGMLGDKDDWLGFKAGSSNTLVSFITAILPELKKDESPIEQAKSIVPESELVDTEISQDIAANYALIFDSGHAWMRVPITWVNPEDYSGYSYKDKQFAYLEEDLDIDVYLKLHPEINKKYNSIDVTHIDGQCYIRELPRLNDKWMSTIPGYVTPADSEDDEVTEVDETPAEDDIKVTYKMADQPKTGEVDDFDADESYRKQVKRTPKVHWEEGNVVGMPVTHEPEVEVEPEEVVLVNGKPISGEKLTDLQKAIAVLKSMQH